MTKKINTDFVFVLPGNSFSGNFISSLVSTTNFLTENDFKFCVVTGYNPIITTARNNLFSNFSFDSINGKVYLPGNLPVKIFDDQVIFKKVIMIDSDILWTLEDIKKILFTDLDVLCGTYLLGDAANSSVKKYKDQPFLTKEELNNEKEIFEGTSSGLGFVSVSYNVLENMKYPWFAIEEKIISKNGKEYQQTIGEDVYFFNKIIDAGFKIYIDPTIKLQHEKVRKLTLG